jgi:hypothetical protein
MREFAQELPHTSAADAWQRAVQLVGENPLDSDGEPRVRKAADKGETPTAEHPFFWAAYLLADSGRLTESQEPPPPPMVNMPKKDPVPAQGDVKPAMKGAPPVGNRPPGAAGMGPPGPAGVGQPGAGAVPPAGAMPPDPDDPPTGKGRKKTKPAKDPAKTKPPARSKKMQDPDDQM